MWSANITKEKLKVKIGKVIGNIRNKKTFIKGGIVLGAIALILVGCLIGNLIHGSSENKTTKIGFEDIGELATQAAYCTEVNDTDESREIFGAKIPFTQSKYIYSYDFVIKAGFDFTKIVWEEKDNKIIVKLPEVTVLSSEPVDDSFKVFYEKESVFRQIKLKENFKTLEDMKNKAVKDAVANGLYDNAKTNAENMLTAFFGSVFDMDKYEMKFIYA